MLRRMPVMLIAWLFMYIIDTRVQVLGVDCGHDAADSDAYEVLCS